MQAMQLLLRLPTVAKRFVLQQAVVVECSEHACTRMRVVCVELIAMSKSCDDKASTRNAKAQPRLYSVQSYKGGVRDGGKLQRQIKNIAQIGA